ncbi:uncharacterized protein B0I36DRAFT_316550 [Microdochium trichocladiopsis]|uniref:Uncharacterized protein n=1 Tax=Microdochium trichocladiopsis TaxID=1682393 RepID=A0A9P8YCT9_9PEZI|nr:uncharacterized protein B0I36DRAFT_316550 [Microdochium trichocladiopsis]KAH7034571.1 hypothetical protein B0I36DRAFT_316550 [Microdochium trichocladiopsis]
MAQWILQSCRLVCAGKGAAQRRDDAPGDSLLLALRPGSLPPTKGSTTRHPTQLQPLGSGVEEQAMAVRQAAEPVSYEHAQSEFKVAGVWCVLVERRNSPAEPHAMPKLGDRHAGTWQYFRLASLPRSWTTAAGCLLAAQREPTQARLLPT